MFEGKLLQEACVGCLLKGRELTSMVSLENEDAPQDMSLSKQSNFEGSESTESRTNSHKAVDEATTGLQELLLLLRGLHKQAEEGVLTFVGKDDTAGSADVILAGSLQSEGILHRGSESEKPRLKSNDMADQTTTDTQATKGTAHGFEDWKTNYLEKIHKMTDPCEFQTMLLAGVSGFG